MKLENIEQKSILVAAILYRTNQNTKSMLKVVLLAEHSVLWGELYRTRAANIVGKRCMLATIRTRKSLATTNFATLSDQMAKVVRDQKSCNFVKHAIELKGAF